MSNFKKIAFFVSVIALSIPGQAQAQVKGDAGINFALGIPQADFADKLDDLGFGLQLNGAVGLHGYPVMIGADLGFFIYGHERRNEPFSYTIPDVTVRVVTDNSIAAGHLFVRIKPDRPVYRPYAEALVGFKHLFTQTKITNEWFEEDEIARSTNFDDTALSYGFGGGFQIRLYQTQEDEEGPSAFYLDFGARYLVGAEAAYLKEGSIRRDNGVVTFDVTRSETTLLIPYVGISVAF